MGRMARAAWLAVLTAAATACGGLPSESYEWNAALAGSGGKLDGMVKALPLGNLSLLEHQHPDDPKKDTITFSNAERLLPFVRRQDAPLAYAAAYFQEGNGVSGAAYAALLPVGRQPATPKSDFYTGEAGSSPLEMGALLTYWVHPVTGLLPSDSPCKLFLVEGSAGIAALPSFVALVGSSKNLYLELVTRGELQAARERRYDEVMSGAPFEAKGDWTQPSLAALRKAHDQTRLEVCKLPA